MGIHWQELIVVLLVVLVLFGPKRLPEIGSSLGTSIRGFKDSLNGHGQHPSAASVTAANADREVAPGAATVASAADLPAAAPVPVEVVDVSTPGAAAGADAAPHRAR